MQESMHAPTSMNMGTGVSVQGMHKSTGVNVHMRVYICVLVCVCVCARMHCTALMSPHALYCFAIMLCARVVFACMN